MDCRQFRKHHSQFLDDVLSGVATWAMRDHLAGCAECARHDTQVRRALMLARSAPRLDVSDRFQRRLSARLAAERLAGPFIAPRPRWGRYALAAAAGVTLFVASATVVARRQPAPGPNFVLAPVVVTPPALPAEPVAAPAMFATVSSSLPVYPAMLLAQRVAVQFAATHARTVNFQATH